MSQLYDSILQTIGNTPIVKLLSPTNARCSRSIWYRTGATPPTRARYVGDLRW